MLRFGCSGLGVRLVLQIWLISCADCFVVFVDLLNSVGMSFFDLYDFCLTFAVY